MCGHSNNSRGYNMNNYQQTAIVEREHDIFGIDKEKHARAP